jgi:uncharacterized protein
LNDAPVEQGVCIALGSDQLLGVHHLPRGKASSIGIVVVVGGPQYRAGSHRQFVQIARALAAAGHDVLRFDVRGMGDSTGAPRSFEHIGDDIAAAVDALFSRAAHIDRVVLWGLCDGASASLMYVHSHRDSRIAGLVLLNPWVRSEQTLARTQVRHYYGRRLLEPSFWRKLFSGQVACGALQELASAVGKSVRAAQDGRIAPTTFQHKMGAGWDAMPGRLLLFLSGQDYTAKEFLELARTDSQWQRRLAEARVSSIHVQHTDHTFADQDARQSVEHGTVQWLRLLM